MRILRRSRLALLAAAIQDAVLAFDDLYGKVFKIQFLAPADRGRGLDGNDVRQRARPGAYCEASEGRQSSTGEPGAGCWIPA